MGDFENETFDCVIDKGLLDSMLVTGSTYAVRNILQTEQQKDAERNITRPEEQGSLHMYFVWGPRHPQPLLLGPQRELQLGAEEPMALQDIQADDRPRREGGHFQVRGQGEEQGLLPLCLHSGQGRRQLPRTRRGTVQVVGSHD